MRFLTWLLSKDDPLISQCYLCRQVSQDTPHQTDDSRLRSIRALAKTIPDSLALVRRTAHQNP
ncbi:MAG: hypothetical protein V1800_12185 [Candidatus Latescibacterota bacterium]